MDSEPDSDCQRSRLQGFTLPELLIVITIIAVLLGLGVPQMRNIVERQGVQSVAQAFSETLYLARIEAIKRNAPISICASASATSPTPACAQVGANWSAGWLTFVDRGAAGQLDGDDFLVSAFQPTASVSAVDDAPNAQPMTFFSLGPMGGLPAAMRTITFATGNPGSFDYRRNVCVSMSGHVSVKDGRTSCT